jgi:uncharacterized protein Yka (UPF0111/DUF47 family)
VLLDRLVQFLLPRENKFFIYLDSMGKNVLAGAETFSELARATGFDDYKRIAERLKRTEHENDEIAHLLYEELDKTFVTPIDREDLHDLCSSLDSVLDVAEGCAARIEVFRLSRFTDAMKELTRLYAEAAREVVRSVSLLSDMAQSDEINTHFVRVHSLENEADKVYRKELERLYTSPPKDPIDLLREQQILDALERSVDATKACMDLVRSVCVKNG